jgi:2-polyprenyl-6-methoxyphenol hydroxylase-like FAD-dependent oxidoreductase
MSLIPARRVSTDHDVIVVGARAAGASTALLLARAGHDVVMVDRARLPSDTTSTHSLVRGGVVQLSRWGLLDDVVDSGAPPIRSVLFSRYGDGAPAAVRLGVKDKAGVDMMLAPRRYVLDAILAESAVRAGATLLTGATATGIIRSGGGRAAGVRVRTADGPTRSMHARVVVGADGVRSRMAELLGAEAKESHPPSGACLYTYVGDVPWDGFEFHLADQAFAGVFPTHDGEAAVWLMQPTARLASVLRAGAGRQQAWLDALEQTAPTLAARVRLGRITAPLRGTVGLPNHLRRASGPGWALVGDAGYHRDPITGHGLTDAFRDAELLAEAIHATLLAPASERDAMQAYEDERDRAIRELFRVTRELGDFPPPARFAELQTELSCHLDVEARQLASRPSLLRPVGIC